MQGKGQRVLGVVWLLISFMFICTSLEARPLIQPKKHNSICVAYEFEEPYQYISDREGVKIYTGLDIEILETIVGSQGVINYQHISWANGLKALKEGQCDVVLGAFYSKKRQTYAYYSKPYRVAHDRFYFIGENKFNYANVKEFLKSKQIKKLKLGVIKNVRYTDNDLNIYIQKHPKQFVFLENDRALIQSALDKKIAGFFAEKTKMEMLLWRTGFHSKIHTSEMDIGGQAIHIMYSKKTVTPSYVEQLNQRLTKLKNSSDYTNLVRKYRVPLFIAMTTDTWAYHLLEILGTMFYAISGLLLAKEARFSLTGAFILAMLPGIGGGLMRDIMLDRDPVGVLRTPIYFLTVVFTTMFFYFFIRARRHIEILQKISNYFHEHMFVKEFSIVRATDAFGLAAFTIIGVMVSVEVQARPLWMWGPVISVLSSTGGGILRDFFMGRELNRTFFYETSFIWSLLLTSYIIIRTQTISATEIFYAITVTFIGIILTRITILKKGWQTKDFWLD